MNTHREMNMSTNGYVKQLFETRIAAFCISDEPRSELAREFGDRIQSRNVPLGTSDDSYLKIFLIQFLHQINQCIQSHRQHAKNHNRHEKPIHLKYLTRVND